MEYTIMFYMSPDQFTARTDPKKRAEFWGSFGPYLQAIKDSGAYLGGAGLEPPQTATTVKMRNGKRLVQDGPYADTKEQLAGFILLNVPNLDRALEWAARFPGGPQDAVEVRPNLPPYPQS